MHYNSIFQQLFNFIPGHRFEKAVKNLSGDYYSKTFSTRQQLLTCLYAQITGKDSLREIERGLVANHNRLYHLGMTAVAKSTLADAMNRRNPQMFEALFNEILDRAVACARGINSGSPAAIFASVEELIPVASRRSFFFRFLSINKCHSFLYETCFIFRLNK